MLTLTNVLFGLLAIAILIRMDFPHKEFAVAGLIVAGGIIDFFDGYLARKLDAISDMGKQLDSFADLITFGVAPICMLYYLASHNQSVLILMGAFAFLVAGIYRLARYNLSSSADKHFTGLPITAAGVLLALYCAAHVSWSPLISQNICVAITLSFILLLSILMASKFKVDRFHLG